MSSPVTAAAGYEIWLYARPALRMPVAECGSFRSEGDARSVGALVRLYLQFGVFGAELRAAVPDPDDQTGLFGLRGVVEGLGYDPARVLVTVRRGADPETRYSGDVPEGVWRADPGHEARGPHAGAWQ